MVAIQTKFNVMSGLYPWLNRYQAAMIQCLAQVYTQHNARGEARTRCLWSEPHRRYCFVKRVKNKEEAIYS